MSQLIGPALPPNFKRQDSVESKSSDQISSDLPSENKKSITGPTPPSSVTKNDVQNNADESTPKKRVYGPAVLKPDINDTQVIKYSTYEDESEQTVGPARPSSERDLSSVYDERVLQRKRQLDQEAEDWEKKKWKAGESKDTEKEKKTLQREEWMLTLPEDRKQMNVQGPRQFSKSGNVNKVDKSWTESPLDAKTKQEEKYDPKADYEVHKAEEQSKLFDKLNTIRGPSLYEAHQEKLKKEKKQDEGGSISNVGYVRPFDRDKDLDTRKVDSNSRKKLVDSSKMFNSNFVRGSQ